MRKNHIGIQQRQGLLDIIGLLYWLDRELANIADAIILAPRIIG
jgi:hypothetical protein